MMGDRPPQKVPLIFFRSGKGTEPVREWLKELPTRRTARVILCLYDDHLVAPHGS
jgi:hypothetical protein